MQLTNTANQYNRYKATLSQFIECCIDFLTLYIYIKKQTQLSKSCTDLKISH